MTTRLRHFTSMLLTGLVIGGLSMAPSTAPASALQDRVTTPLEEFGGNIGDDYFLVNYQQLVAYWQKLEQESDRMALEVIGETEQGLSLIHL